MSFHVKAALFVLVSAALAYVSRRPLRDVHSHGFYRFFAWEAIAVLVLLNLDDWFVDPWAPHQIVSWFLLIISGFLVVHGVRLLRMLGRPNAAREGDALIGIEKTTQLVTAGAYRYIRHPLYSSLLFLAWGVFFKLPSWPGAGLAIAATMFLTATAKIEEGENRRFFGSEYGEYMKRTTMFIPFVF